MGRTKRSKRSFSPNSKARVLAWGSGHSWFNQSNGSDRPTVEGDDKCEGDTGESHCETDINCMSDNDDTHTSMISNSNENVHIIDLDVIPTASTDTESNNSSDEESEINIIGASAKKIKLDKTLDTYSAVDYVRGIVDYTMLKDSFDYVRPLCRICETGILKIIITKHIGLATEIAYICSNSDCPKNVITTDFTFSMSKKQGHKHDINKSLVLAMREIGRGHAGAKKLCASLGLPKPVSHHPYANYNREWYEHSMEMCEESMKRAADELRQQLTGLHEEQYNGTAGDDSKNDGSMVMHDGDANGDDFDDNGNDDTNENDNGEAATTAADDNDDDNGDAATTTAAADDNNDNDDNGDASTATAADDNDDGNDDNDNGDAAATTSDADYDDDNDDTGDIHSDDGSDVPDDEVILDCDVSVDGSWMTRGHHSRHGFVSVISDLTGKVIDRIHMCKDCIECKRWENSDQSGIEYLEWYTAHEPTCMLNHTGSPHGMEAEGALELFRRSVTKYGLRYETFIGDGDAKSYEGIVKAAPYGPTYVIEKEECAGHIQKRMGTRLRSVVSQFRGEIAVIIPIDTPLYDITSVFQ